MRIFWCLLPMAVLTSTVHADPLSITTNSCPTAPFGAQSPSGVTYNPDSDELVVIDVEAGAAFRVTRQCALQGAFSLAVLGATQPSGITYDGGEGKYAIVDGAEDEIFFAGSDGASLGRCDLRALGVRNPTGIAYDSASDAFAIVTDNSGEIVRIDDRVLDGGTCGLVDRNDIFQIDIQEGSGLGYLPATGQLVVASDWTEDRVYVLSPEFDLDGSFRTLMPANIDQSGITYDPQRDRIYIADAQNAQLVELDIRGTVSLKCSLESLDLFSPSGLTINGEANQLSVVDGRNDEDILFYLNGDTCLEEAQVSLSAQGISAPSGIAYRPSTKQLVIADSILDELFFVNYETGQVESSCDLGELGLEIPRGVAVIEFFDWIVVVANQSDTIAVLDSTCTIVEQTSLLTFSGPSGLAVEPTTGRIVSADAVADLVTVTTFDGIRDLTFNAAALGLISIDGLTYTSGAQYLAIDSFIDAIYVLEAPLLAEPRTLAGTFAGNDVSAFIFVGEDGNLTGGLRLPATTVSVYGQYNSRTRAIDLGFTLPNGNAVVLTGVASEDLETLNLPAPIGTLTRQR